MRPVVLSGGSGTRLWPISRKKFPKQFCEIFNDSLQNLTLKRVAQMAPPVLVTGRDLRTLTEIHVQKSGIAVSRVIFEPIAKNTAPAVLVACRWFELQGLENECLGFFPADHLIQDESEFVASVELAEKVARQGRVVTLGVRPTYPETGYGYIQKTKKSLPSMEGAFGVVRFHEKPNLEKAKAFLATQEYLWNAGIFVGVAKDFLAAFKKHQPALWESVQMLKSDLSNIEDVYHSFPNLSVDYAIMEKLTEKEMAVVPVDLGWNDVGSWDAVAEHFRAHGQNEKGTTVYTNKSSHSNFVFSQTQRPVGFVDVDNLIVVDTADAVLIAEKGSSQNVRQIVDQLAAQKSKLAEDTNLEERPWGQYEVLRDSETFKSKVIRVNPQSQLSYQSHAKRAEHWIITQGQGEVILDDQVIPVKAGSHVHIPVKAKHRIRNTGNQALEFIEVQLGTYFGEDDIVRYSDDYGRA